MAKFGIRDIAGALAIAILLLTQGCGDVEQTTRNDVSTPVMAAEAPTVEAEAEPASTVPDLQAELTNTRFRTSDSPIAGYDFLNHSYPLPRGWENRDGSEAQLVNGRLDPVSLPIHEDMPDEEKIRRRAERRIGLSHVVTKYFDANGDGSDEAIVILKIETTGNAIPQIVYVYEWSDEGPKLMWHFRTGDRADGGLKSIRPDDGELVIELYGQDRFMLGEVETGKVQGDEVQICCPTHYTLSSYKWNGRHFIRQGPRLTFLTDDPSAPPIENLGDIIAEREKNKK